MNTKKKNRKQHISILLIPDDFSDPFSFKVKIRTLKILGVIASLLVVHIFVGIVFYYKYSVTNHYRKQLERDNINLKEDNQQIHSLWDKVEELYNFQSKVRKAFEVDKGFEVSDRKTAQIMNDLRTNINLLPEQLLHNSDAEAEDAAQKKIDFLTRKKNYYHEFANNIPTYLPVEGWLSTDFRKNDLSKPNHFGIDIASSRGSFINAAADGVVIFANWTDDLGNLMIVYHFNGFLTFYGHNQMLLKRENMYVKKGEPIALLGNSGRSTAPHLHYEVWKDGVPVDPKDYLLRF
ncbi:MAG: M23 family metallopeptidase [Candidatus Zhuqueibacterota bacterium]